jgi:hypothetical protein
MVVESELRREIARVVGGNASLADLYRWLVARNWNLLRNSDDAAIDLAGEVEEILREWSDGLQGRAAAVAALSSLLARKESLVFVSDCWAAPYVEKVSSSNNFWPSQSAQWTVQLA